MYYELIPQNGDTLAVPLLVFSNLPRADENCMRVALYVLQTGCTDSAVIARELGLRSVHAAERALQWWAGAGLLKAHRGHSPEPAVLPAAEPEPDLSLVLCDPRIALIMEQAQSCLGGALSSQESRNLASLYTTEGYAADVILLCLSHLTGQPGVNLNAVRSELKRWKKAGVRSGEDVERLLALADLRLLLRGVVAVQGVQPVQVLLILAVVLGVVEFLEPRRDAEFIVAGIFFFHHTLEGRVILIDDAVLRLVALDRAVGETAGEVGVRVARLGFLPLQDGGRICLGRSFQGVIPCDGLPVER